MIVMKHSAARIPFDPKTCFFRIIEANYIEIVKRNEKFVSKFVPVPDTFYFENGAIFDGLYSMYPLNNGKYHKRGSFLRSIPLSTHGSAVNQPDSTKRH